MVRTRGRSAVPLLSLALGGVPKDPLPYTLEFAMRHRLPLVRGHAAHLPRSLPRGAAHDEDFHPPRSQPDQPPHLCLWEKGTNRGRSTFPVQSSLFVVRYTAFRIRAGARPRAPLKGSGAPRDAAALRLVPLTSRYARPSLRAHNRHTAALRPCNSVCVRLGGRIGLSPGSSHLHRWEGEAPAEPTSNPPQTWPFPPIPMRFQGSAGASPSQKRVE